MNGVRPGFIYTEILDGHAAGSEEFLENIRINTPLRRIGEVEDVTGAVLWLLSNEARHVSGTIIDISGARVTQ